MQHPTPWRVYQPSNWPHVNWRHIDRLTIIDADENPINLANLTTELAQQIVAGSQLLSMGPAILEVLEKVEKLNCGTSEYTKLAAAAEAIKIELERLSK